MFLMNLAGIPPTTVFAATCFDTTAPAATTAFSPIVTPGNIVAPDPIHAFLLITIGFPIKALRSVGSKGWFSVTSFTCGPISTSSSNVIPPLSKKEQA